MCLRDALQNSTALAARVIDPRGPYSNAEQARFARQALGVNQSAELKQCAERMLLSALLQKNTPE
jgi:hypothetical protein